MLRYLKLFGRVAVEDARARGQPFEGADANVVALDDGARREFFDEKLCKRRLQAFRSLRERLKRPRNDQR